MYRLCQNLLTLAVLSGAVALAGCQPANMRGAIQTPEQIAAAPAYTHSRGDANVTFPAAALKDTHAHVREMLGSAALAHVTRPENLVYHPPVLYFLHGCNSATKGYSAYAIEQLAARLGFVAVSPLSMERTPSCKMSRHRYERLLETRRAELRSAKATVEASGWYAGGSAFLAGHSQGGAIVIHYPHRGFTGYIVTGVDCPNHQIKLGRHLPLLYMVSENDDVVLSVGKRKVQPCSMNNRTLSHSLILKGEQRHVIMGLPEVQTAIVDFIERYMPTHERLALRRHTGS